MDTCSESRSSTTDSSSESGHSLEGPRLRLPHVTYSAVECLNGQNMCLLYPVGYQAAVRAHGALFQMEILQGLGERVFRVIGPNGKMTWQGATPSLAWSQVPSCWTRDVVSGLAQFGLSDPVVRRAIWSSYTPLQQQSITQEALAQQRAMSHVSEQQPVFDAHTAADSGDSDDIDKLAPTASLQKPSCSFEESGAAASSPHCNDVVDTCELGSTCDSAFLHVQRHQACELLVKSLNADDVTSHAIDDWSGSAEVERFHHSDYWPSKILLATQDPPCSVQYKSTCWSPLISTRSQRVYEFRQWCLVQFLDNSQVFPANQRLSDGCVHLPAQCVLQPGKDSLAGNAICNATTSAISILPEADLMTRVKDTDVWIPVRGQVLKMVDNGAGFSPDEAFFDTSGNFGRFGQGLKCAASTLSSCYLLMSKSKHTDGTIWHTVLWFHNNCKQGGSHIQNVIAWPATFTGTTKEDFAHAGLLEGASREKSYANIFRLGGQPWAPLPHVSAAHQLFKKIVDTGTVKVTGDDISLQGTSLRAMLQQLFLPSALGLTEPGHGDAKLQPFQVEIKVSESHNVITQASQPQYPVSPPITVSIGQARHLVAYGPYCSLDVAHSFFPYSPGSGQTYHSQNYGFNLANGCPVIHPLSSPEASGCSRSDYFSSLQDLKTPAADLYERFLATLSGLGHGHGFDQHAEELYAELQANRVFDDSNPYLHNQAYARQLQNLRWLLGSPFEVTVKIDTQHLQLNTRGDDLQDDAAERDVFFAAVHAAIAIDVLKRFVPGLQLMIRNTVLQTGLDKPRHLFEQQPEPLVSQKHIHAGSGAMQQSLSMPPCMQTAAEPLRMSDPQSSHVEVATVISEGIDQMHSLPKAIINMYGRAGVDLFLARHGICNVDIIKAFVAKLHAVHFDTLGSMLEDLIQIAYEAAMESSMQPKGGAWHLACHLDEAFGLLRDVGASDQDFLLAVEAQNRTLYLLFALYAGDRYQMMPSRQLPRQYVTRLKGWRHRVSFRLWRMHYRLQAMANFRSSAGNCDKSEVTQNTGARGSMPEHFDEAISCKHSLAPSLPDRVLPRGSSAVSSESGGAPYAAKRPSHGVEEGTSSDLKRQKQSASARDWLEVASDLRQLEAQKRTLSPKD